MKRYSLFIFCWLLSSCASYAINVKGTNWAGFKDNQEENEILVRKIEAYIGRGIGIWSVAELDKHLSRISEDIRIRARYATWRAESQSETHNITKTETYKWTFVQTYAKVTSVPVVSWREMDFVRYELHANFVNGLFVGFDTAIEPLNEVETRYDTSDMLLTGSAVGATVFLVAGP